MSAKASPEKRGDMKQIINKWGCTCCSSKDMKSSPAATTCENLPHTTSDAASSSSTHPTCCANIRICGEHCVNRIRGKSYCACTPCRDAAAVHATHLLRKNTKKSIQRLWQVLQKVSRDGHNRCNMLSAQFDTSSKLFAWMRYAARTAQLHKIVFLHYTSTSCR